MKTTIEVIIKRKLDLDITSATLLSVREAECVPENIRAIGQCWWLRSPGNYADYAAFVNSYGYVDASGYGVGLGDDCVRPALSISNLASNNLEIGDKIEVKDISFTVISDTLALADEPIGQCAFREDWKASDANDYEASDIKKFVDEWFNELMN